MIQFFFYNNMMVYINLFIFKIPLAMIYSSNNIDHWY
jgi:hypothetical protein